MKRLASTGCRSVTKQVSSFDQSGFLAFGPTLGFLWFRFFLRSMVFPDNDASHVSRGIGPLKQSFSAGVYSRCHTTTRGRFSMRPTFLLLLLASFAPSLLAESHNPADYPLRVHIYRHNETTFYRNRQAEEAKGEGRANLFESGQPKGIDFQFECDQKLQSSSGFETFPAKWKKAGQELVILQPQFGKSGYDTCRLKVMVKDFVYVARNGNLTTEPSELFKQWMQKHDYDPEHGKTTPSQLGPAPASAATGATPSPQATKPASAPPQ